MQELDDIRTFLTQLKDGWSGDHGKEVFGKRQKEVVTGLTVLLLHCAKIEDKLNEQSSRTKTMG